MITFLFDLFLAILLFKKKTPASLVIGIACIVLVVLVVTVIRQATYFN